MHLQWTRYGDLGRFALLCLAMIRDPFLKGPYRYLRHVYTYIEREFLIGCHGEM